MYKKANIFLSVLFLVLLLAVCSEQFLLYGGYVKAVSNHGDNGRTDAKESSIYCPSGMIGLKLSDEDRVIMKNGEIITEEFRRGDVRYYSVNDGDVFHADIRNCDESMGMYVYDASENVLFPKVGTKAVISRPVSVIFDVKVAK